MHTSVFEQQDLRAIYFNVCLPACPLTYNADVPGYRHPDLYRYDCQCQGLGAALEVECHQVETWTVSCEFRFRGVVGDVEAPIAASA